jgi:outer membrane protein TolC
VVLTLPEVIQTVVRSNRELQNAQLDRRVQRQELREAESVFNPRFIPTIGIGITTGPGLGGTVPTPITLMALPSDRSLTRTVSGATVSGFGRSVQLDDQTVWNNEAQVQAQLLTRIGTRFNLTGDPLSDFPLNLTMTQPLLRGFGKTVNEAPVQAARLTYTKGEQALRQTLISKVTDTIGAYRGLYQRQEAVRIQESALANLRYQLQVTTALVNAGRKARADLVDIEQRLAESERQLISDRNQLLLANSTVLRLMETPDTYLIRVTPESIEALIQAAIARAQTLDPDRLLQTAYQQRPDFLQARLDIDTERFNLISAQDRKRWGLDLQSITSVGANSQTAARLVLSREFGNPTLETDVQRRQVGIEKNTNRLEQLTLTIQSELTDQLKTIQALQQQIVAAQQASQLAQRQLAIAQTRFKRGQTTIFEVTQKEETFTDALNRELGTKLDFWVALAELDRILGTTLDTWGIALSTQLK